MDAISASGSGFDEALKALQALEDVEADAAPLDDGNPAAKLGSIGPIAFSDADFDSEPVAIMAAPIEEIDPAVSDTVHESIADHPAGAAAPVAAAPVPVAVAVPRAPSRMLYAAVGLGLVSSIISAAGLVVAERTIMSAQLVVADARERADQLAKANQLIRDLEIVRARQVELLQAQQAQVASTPVTSAELQHKMDNLQSGLLARDPLNTVVAAIRASQLDDAAQFNEFGMKIARLEKAVEGK